MLARRALSFSLLMFGGAVSIVARGASDAHGASQADVLPPALSWDAPRACPSADVLEHVMRLTGLSRERLGTKLLRVDAVVRPAAIGGWQARLAIVTAGGAGERHFSAEDCGSLRDGAALVLALAVDPRVATALGTPPSRTGIADLPAPPSAEVRSSRPQALLRPRLAAELGVLPKVGLAYGLAAGLAWPRLRLELDASFMSAQEVRDQLGRGGRIRPLASARASACLVPGRYGRIEPAACLGPALHWLRSTGNDGIAFTETHDTLAIACFAGAAVGVRLRDWLWLRAEGALGLVVRRPRFHVVEEAQTRSEVYSVRQLTGHLGGGLEFRF